MAARKFNRGFATMVIAAVTIVVLAGTAQAECASETLADRCACLADDVPGARSDADATCHEVSFPALDKVGLSALELGGREPGLFVGAKTPAGWRVLAPLSPMVNSYNVYRDTKVTATKRKAGAMQVIWIVTRSEDISSVPDPCCLVETRIKEEITVCVLDAHARCPVSAFVVRAGDDSWNTRRWTERQALARARKDLRVIATLTLRDGAVFAGKTRFDLR